MREGQAKRIWHGKSKGVTGKAWHRNAKNSHTQCTGVRREIKTTCGKGREPEEEAEGCKVQPGEATERKACWISLMTQIRRLVQTTLLYQSCKKQSCPLVRIYHLSLTFSLGGILHLKMETEHPVSDHAFSPKVCHSVLLSILVVHSGSS